VPGHQRLIGTAFAHGNRASHEADSFATAIGIFCSYRSSHAVLQMAGGSALSRRLSEIAAMDEVKAAKMQAEYEAQQDAALQKKKRDRQEQQQLLLRTRQQQVLHALQRLRLSVHACVAVELVCQLA